MAADPAMTQWPQLQYLDISFNPLDAGTPTLPPIWASTNMSTNRLPDSWVQIRLEVLKVSPHLPSSCLSSQSEWEAFNCLVFRCHDVCCRKTLKYCKQLPLLHTVFVLAVEYLSM